MLPVIFSLGGFTLYTFGIFLVLAFFWSTYLLWCLTQLTSYKEEDVFDSMFIAVLAGLIASRATYIATHFSEFGLDLARMILVNGYPGMSIHGFIIGFVSIFALACARRKMKPLELIDYISPAILIGLAIGTLGAFFAGSMLGSRTTFPLAVTYVGHEGLRHVTGLYASIAYGVATYVSYRIIFAIRRDTYKRGANLVFLGFATSLIMTATAPLTQQKPLLAGFGLEALISAFLLLTFLVLFLYYFRNLFYTFFASITTRFTQNGTKH
jgi:prolipoprotein diacylglyceryltransferase